MILTNWRRATEITITHYGQVGAGKVVDFVPRGKKKAAATTNVNAQQLAFVTVSGDSLRDVGISDGDELLCKIVTDRSEVKNGKLVIAQLPCLGLVVKFFYEFDNKIVLRSANPKYQDLIFEKDIVEIKAVVHKSLKNWE